MQSIGPGTKSLDQLDLIVPESRICHAFCLYSRSIVTTLGRASTRSIRAVRPASMQRRAPAGDLYDSEQISSGLQAIADSRTDDQFVAAVLGMCEVRAESVQQRIHLTLTVAGLQMRDHPNIPADPLRCAGYDNELADRPALSWNPKPTPGRRRQVGQCR
jgi:hypothetical protein